MPSNINILHAAVMVATESGDYSVHLLQYPEGHPESVAESLRGLFEEDDFPYISRVEVDVQGDYSDLNTLGRKSRRVKEEIKKLIKQAREEWEDE